MSKSYSPFIWEPSDGGSGSTTYVHERLIGTVNGINKVFTTSNPYVLNSEIVWFDGVRMEKNEDYTRSLGNTITFMDAPIARSAPKSDSIVSIQYIPQ